MVSKLQRHLSLLLVVVITSSWLVVPSALQAQSIRTEGEETGSAPVTVTNTKTKSTTGDICSTDYTGNNNATEKIFNRTLTPTLPTFQHRCFVYSEQNGYITHKFHYFVDQAGKDNIYEQRYRRANNPPLVYGGCETRPGVTGCSKGSPNTYNYFTFYDAVDISRTGQGAEAGQVARWQTFSDQKMEIYQLDTPLTYGNAVARNTYLIVNRNSSSPIVYGLYEITDPNAASKTAAARIADRERNIHRIGDVADGFYDFFFKSQKNINAQAYKGSTAYEYYAANVNGLDRPQEQRGTIGRVPHKLYIAGATNTSNSNNSSSSANNTPSAAFTAATKAISDLFSAVNLTHISLHDYIDKDGNEDRTQPPIIDLSPSATTLNKKISFQLTHVLFSSGGHTRNNYFLFRIIEDPNTLATELSAVEKDNFYLAVDAAGNIAFIVDDPARNGGILNPQGKVLDSFMVFPSHNKFDVDNRSESKNPRGEALHFVNDPSKWQDYQDIIIKRVYNDPADENAGVTCKGSLPDGNVDYSLVTLYPNTNSGYIPPRFPKNIPGSSHRQCINGVKQAGTGTGTTTDNHPPGWLVKWGVSIIDIEQSTGDNIECLTYFGGNTWYNFAGKSICWVLGIIIGGAVNFAGFSVELLIEAAGLQ